MHNELSRITLINTGIECKRVREITEEEARAAGAETDEYLEYREWANSVAPPGSHIQTLREHYGTLWDKHYHRSEFDPRRFDTAWGWKLKFEVEVRG